MKIEFFCSKDHAYAHKFGPLLICDLCYKKFFFRENGKEILGTDRTRMIARFRDRFTCQECGFIWEHGRHFDIHHIKVCGEKSRKYDRICDLGDLITLCHVCHLSMDSVRMRMYHRNSPRPLKDKQRQKEWKNKKL